MLCDVCQVNYCGRLRNFNFANYLQNKRFRKLLTLERIKTDKALKVVIGINYHHN